MILAAGSSQLVIRSLHSLYQLNILRLRQLNIHKTASPLGLGHIFRDWARGPLGGPSGKNIIRFRRWTTLGVLCLGVGEVPSPQGWTVLGEGGPSTLTPGSYMRAYMRICVHICVDARIYAYMRAYMRRCSHICVEQL